MTRLALLYYCLLTSVTGFSQERIITAGSSSTEIVCALGYCDKIIATDKTSVYPEKMQSLPSVGYRNSVNAEGIISQRPDIVIFEKDYIKDEVIAQIQSTGIKMLVVNNEQNFVSTKNRIRAIATALDRKEKAESLIQEIDQQLSALEKKVNATNARPSVLCVYNRGSGNMMVAGKNTSFGLLPLAGTVNAVPDLDGYKPLNTEYLIKANPDYILFFSSGLESIGGITEALKIPGVLETTAGKKKQIISMDGIMLTNWGPRVADAAGQLFQLTHSQPR